ncbi:MAG TPA: penicillin-binding protein 2, partial [Propionibacteriaceae bacterium]|nr:penicillin-binding protein 2 [Propionibacteriaceae bacterium]
MTKLPVGKPQARVRIMLVVMAFLFSLLAGRALQVQALDAEANAAEAAKQMTVARDLPAVRGQITDSSGLVLAYTESAVNVIGNPDTIADNGKEHPTAKDLDFAKAAPAKIAAILVKYLGGADADYLPGLTKANTKYVILAKQIQAATYDAMSKELAA